LGGETRLSRPCLTRSTERRGWRNDHRSEPNVLQAGRRRRGRSRRAAARRGGLRTHQQPAPGVRDRNQHLQEDTRQAEGRGQDRMPELRQGEEVKLYIIGSLPNPKVTEVASALPKAGFDVFGDWYAAAPDADDAWRDYEKSRGRTYLEALGGYAARHVFDFDKHHLDQADAAVLVAPAGKSAHLELGYMIGRGRPGYILLDPEVERWDVMYQFATGLADGVDELVQMVSPPAAS